MQHLKSIFESFGSVSGLCINFNKSEIAFIPNTPNRFKKMMAKSSHLKVVDKFQKYLGSYVDEEPKSRRVFETVYNNLLSRLEGWQTQLLSQAGRVVLIKSVLSSLPLYHLSYFKLTEQEAHKCDSVLNNFFWGNHSGRKAPQMKAWDTICLPANHGGLGIKKFSDFNKAMLGRQAWRILHNRDCLLSRVYFAKYCKDKANYVFSCNSQPSPFARYICNRINDIIQDCKWRVGNGRSITLHDRLWVPPDPMSDDMFLVSHLMNQAGDWDIAKVQSLYDPPKVQQILNIPTSHTGIDDRIIWTKQTHGNYSVKEAYSLLSSHDSTSNQEASWKVLWKLPGAPKILLFG